MLFGDLVNTPTIGSVNEFVIDSNKVNRGDLFFALDSNDSIESAINRGAFSVVIDSSLMKSNAKLIEKENEIAWIRVDNIRSSIMRLIRFKLLTMNIKCTHLSYAQFVIAKRMITTESVVFYDGDLVNILDVLKPNINLLTTNKVIKDLVIEQTECPVFDEIYPIEVIDDPRALSESRFCYGVSKFILPIPEVFLPEIASLIRFCNNENLNFSFYNFSPIESLLPIYVNQNAQILPFGASSKLVVASEDMNTFFRYIKILKERITWGMVSIFIPAVLDEASEFLREFYFEKFNEELEAKIYQADEDLSELLKDHYDFAVVFGLSLDGVRFVLKNSIMKSYGLFENLE